METESAKPAPTARPVAQRGLRRLLGACLAPTTRDMMERPTFAQPGQVQPPALVALPLPTPPRPHYLPKPPNTLSPERCAKLAAKITAELDRAAAAGLQGRSLEANLRKNVWGRLAFDNAMFGNGNKSQALGAKLRDLHSTLEKTMVQFAVQAKALLPQMNERDIKRASTNVWPMLCLQALNGQPLTLTPSVIGYSLLYPLTDDIVDAPNVSPAAKQDFLARFARQISHGDAPIPIDANNPREHAVWQMFGMIESQWDRRKHPLTYRAMGELLQAQVDSQLQLAGPQHGDRPVPSFAPLWEVTVRKGALSILCDAYLVKGHLNAAESSFAAHFGLMTQFLNDIRTVDQDLAEGQYTPFNLLSQRGDKLDAVLDAVFNHFWTTFTAPAHAAVYGKDRSKKAFMGVMLAFLSFKLLEGVAINQDKFSPDYLSHLETVSAPLPLDLIKRLFYAQCAGDNHAAAILPNLSAA